jgi:alkylation response protein AidB-like acyl-CoA dehydrogenase
MDVNFSNDELEFRQEVRQFFATEFPQDVLEKQAKAIPLEREDVVKWHKAMYAKGWAAPNWPVELGGTGWSPVQKYLFADEQARVNAPPFLSFGVSMVGPIIYSYGSEAQKKRFLPDILEFNTWWCQGYSEPGAGSDLASLSTRANLEGDHYVVNGTKTWTTLGQYADWIFCLVRTNTDVARRQEGISFLLIDMKQPGVTVKPIVLMEGAHEVNEIHFDNVRVPVENLVGEEGKGWTYGKVLLQHERTGIAGVAGSKYQLRALRTQAEQSNKGAAPLAEDRNFMRKIAAAEVELKALEFTELRTLASVASGKAPGPESSILKIAGTELRQTIDSLRVEAAAYYALPYVRDQFVDDFPDDDRIGSGTETVSLLTYLNNRKVTIFGGSNEIQKNIIAKHVLGL